jgi:Zn-dependent protease
MTYFLCIMAFYLACWVRLIVHELGHFIVAKKVGGHPYVITLGGRLLRVYICGVRVNLGIVPFFGSVGYYTDKLSNKQHAKIAIAGPWADVIALPIFATICFFVLPEIVFSAVCVACLIALGSDIESRFEEGHDLSEYFRLTS